MGRAVPALARLSEQTARQDRLQSWLEARLPAEALAHLTGIRQREDGNLVLFTESAAWCARLRYLAAEIEGEIRQAHPEIGQVIVRVRPR